MGSSQNHGVTARGASRKWISWPVSLVVNSVLGYLATLPFSMLIFVLYNTLFSSLGWVKRDTKFGDETGFVVTFAAGSTLAVLAVFVGVNYLVVRLSGVSRRWYWPLSSAVLLIPMVLQSFLH